LRCGKDNGFLRAELPRILAKPPDVLSPRMVRIIEDLACDWRRLDERVEGLSNEIETIARQDAGCERLMRARHRTIISSAMVAPSAQAIVFTKGRDLPLGSGSFPADLDRGPYHPRQGIQAWQSLPASSVRAARWVVLIKPKIWSATGSSPWLEAARKRLHHNVLAIALANKLAASPWSVLAGGPSRCRRSIRPRPGQPDPNSTLTATETAQN